MKMHKGEKWSCSNPVCRSEFVVTIGSAAENGVNPRCCCGSKMKKAYAAPAVGKIQDPEVSETLDRKALSKVR
jgi:hypothetical protein